MSSDLDSGHPDSADLESRVRSSLADRAGDVGHLSVGGAALRARAARRRGSRMLVAATAAVVVAVAGGVATLLGSGPPEADRAPVNRPTVVPDPSPRGVGEPDPAWLQVPLTDDKLRQALEAAGSGNSLEPVASAPISGSGRIAVLLAITSEQDDLYVVTVTLDPDRPGAPAVSGTSGFFPSYSSLIAQPVRDGSATWLLVLLPPDLGDTVEVTTSAPGESLRWTSAPVTGRLALVPVASPESVTRLRVLRQGRAAVNTIPASSMLGPDVPRTLDRVVASSTGRREQPVQVRTDGLTACRLTAGGWWDGSPAVTWNPFDSACAPVDGRLHLLLADDRRYSSVAGLAPPGTTSVRLSWRSGDDTDVTDVPVVTSEGVSAFVDSSGHRPDQLVKAEATRAGDVIATVLPDQ